MAVSFTGVEPAAGLREIAARRGTHLPKLRILGGRFEALPFASSSLDYACSVLALHWTTDLAGSVRELARVLGSSSEMDPAFIGRHNGREFIQKTSPIFFRDVKPARLIEAAALFRTACDAHELSVEESYHTFYDNLEGHWARWLRIEGQTLDVAPEERAECDAAVRAALASLETEQGIPYIVHLLHVRLRRG